MRSCLPLLMWTLLAAVAAAPSAAEENLAYADLVNRLVNLEHLAVLPAAGEKCAQWSSWDRSSRFDEQTGKYIAWDANGDGHHVIRQEGNQSVLAEMKGPGCIWRIWSALAQEGHVRIYLDGSSEPAVDLPFIKYFTGDTAPFAYPMLSYNLDQMGCRGQNLYYPIPYQKSCKIVADEGWGRYYQFVYTTFAEGTEVPTFSAALAAENAAALAKVNEFLTSGQGTDPAGRRPGEEERIGTTSVGPGETSSVLELEGPRAISSIQAKLLSKPADREQEMAAFRQLAIRITWDGDSQPAVWCPLGDFFGTAPGENHYRTLATGMTDDGYYACWYMPFEKGARIELVNDGPSPHTVQFQIVHAPLNRAAAELGRFHLKWHRDAQPLPPDRWPDWMLLQTEGRGRFCGVMLHVWNPQGGWWGEGDEKFFVDGEKYPSTFGTGSEDYFGYAWCHPGYFQRPFHAQSMTQGNRGHQSVLRWHVADNVPFQKSFEGTIEKYYRTEEKGTQYAATVAWYLAPGGVDPYGAVPVDQRHGYYVKTAAMAGGFKILGEPPGTVQTQGLANYARGKWKNNDHLWWTDARPGQKLEVAVPVKKSGTYRVSVVLTKARDYGIVQLSLDGKKAGEPIDLYNPEVINTDPIPLGVFELEEGEHVLGVEIVGANEKAVKSYMFGLDCVVFEAEK